MHHAALFVVLASLAIVIPSLLAGPTTCNLDGVSWETGGATTSAFCCSNYPYVSATATASWDMTSDDGLDIYINGACDATLAGWCIDCCSDTNCVYVGSCDEGESCTGSYTFGVTDGYNIDTLSFQIHCKSGVFDTCDYTFNSLSLTLDNAGSTSDSCGQCSSLTNATTILY